MRDEAIRLSTIGQILRRRRWLLAALAALGAGIGALASLLIPMGFTSTSTILLERAHSEDTVLTEAQIATSRVVVNRAAIQMGWAPQDVPEDAVSAKVSNGDVIKITATAGTSSQAREFTKRVTREYISFSTDVANRTAHAATEALNQRREDVQHQIDKLREAGDAPLGPPDRRTELQRRLNDIDERIADAKTKAAVNRTHPRVIEPPVETEPVMPTRLQLIVGGMVLAPVLGTLALVAVRLSDRRLRHGSDIASALGAPVLGTVPVPPDRVTTQFETGGWRARTRRRLGNGPPPVEPDGTRDDLRYRRVLDRLRDGRKEQLRLLVVAADDDSLAARATVRLVAAATAGGWPVAVLTDDPQLTTAVQAETAEAGQPPDRVEVPGGLTSVRSAAIVLRLETVNAARPTIRSDPEALGAVVVVTPGTRTAWELFAVAEACQDAMLPLRGALLVVPPGAEEEVGVQPRVAVQEQPAAPQGQLNGHRTGGRV